MIGLNDSDRCFMCCDWFLRMEVGVIRAVFGLKDGDSCFMSCDGSYKMEVGVFT